MRTAIVLLVSLLAAGCTRGAARADEAFDAQTFVTFTAQTVMSDADLGIMAARRGRKPETRQLGSIMHRDATELQQALASIAQRKRLDLPAGIEPRKVALKENLDILPGQVFDRGYALAMLQDMNRLMASFDKASRANDPDLAAFAKQYLPRIQEQRKLATQLLNQLGGSPFA